MLQLVLQHIYALPSPLKKIPHAAGMCTPPNTWFLGLMWVSIPKRHLQPFLLPVTVVVKAYIYTSACLYVQYRMHILPIHYALDLRKLSFLHNHSFHHAAVVNVLFLLENLLGVGFMLFSQFIDWTFI